MNLINIYELASGQRLNTKTSIFFSQNTPLETKA